MVKLTMEDDCLAPETPMTIYYKGPNPFKVYGKISELMKKIWEIDAVAYWERQFRYNPDEDPRGFYVNSYVVKGLDRFSKVIIEVILQGKQPSDPNKEGWVEIKIGGVIKTSFGGSTVLEDIKNPFIGFLYWFYNKVYYAKYRRFLLDFWCRQKLNELKVAIQDLMGILPAGKYEESKKVRV